MSRLDDREEQVRSVFEGALRVSPAEREAFLRSACGSDDSLLHEIRSLVECHESAPPGFMRILDQDDPKHEDPLIGARIGKFDIEETIAVGGMGTVYRACQRTPEREVALKVVRRFLSSDSIVRRFEFESQVLARLHHPHIAQVYDAGMHSVDGCNVPYFAMEYVCGAQPITTYAAEAQLDIPARLGLFMTAALAVHHGHQKGIIHRDLKPSNILVDEDGHVKIIDFGVARAIDSDIALTTLKTDAGQIVGTLQYMSPEQCQADSGDLDTRTDVYSLGVVLFELVCDTLPYDVGGMPVPSAIRVITDTEPTRARGMNHRVSSDLETIISTAIEKDRVRRYASASELAEDIRRHLDGEPIAAKPETTWMRAVRWAIRRPYLATLIVCALIIILTTALTVGAVRYYVAYTPDELKPDETNSRATLFAVNRDELRVWDTHQEDGVRFTRIIDQPRAFGGHRLALVGFAANDHFQSGLYAFGAYDPGRVVWSGTIEDEDIIHESFDSEDTAARHFELDLGEVVDVFDESAGDEIIAIHKHIERTHSLVRVYDLGGNIRYQVWVGVQVKSGYWIEESGLLVLAGRNGRATWQQRGVLGALKHPLVVFAIRPEWDTRHHKYITEVPGTGPLAPQWYKCLLPAEQADLFGRIEVRKPPLGQEQGEVAQLTVYLANEPLAAVPWSLYADGTLAQQKPNTVYSVLRPDLVPSEDVWFGELPPIVRGQQ